ncbi:light-harvesting protein of photosystem I [Raphidocelis subcapitata]|uniref:Chlorophyll a-b binding protein, chloroplastic n=1 Tax=Raphidocelis subcapitata TaxID=307507 RepID=A0A2V0NQ39_9CHLO|nr:light-harvesting protein of photosystem I [Raphidocelis subcapitata]|eukprot:GBF87630.1 light-harvesting protein of photosystem I [Raphidocelis subcapitata]
MLAKQSALARSGVRAAASRRSVRVQAAAARRSWAPGVKAPAHLTGELAGDFGFDPLNLGKDPEALKWYVQSELVHGRTAMTAVAGILIPGILTKAGALNVPEWYDATDAALASSGIDVKALFMVELFLCGFVEGKRWMDFRKPGSQGEAGSFLGFESSLKGVKNGYPGGIFDPLGLTRESPEKTRDLEEKELRNGRLAMVAFAGFLAQHQVTGKGPIDNLIDHLAAPGTTTIWDNKVSIPLLV